jgi:hypothetical protein
MQILTQMMNYLSNLCVETILFPIFGDSDITPKDRVVRGGKEKILEVGTTAIWHCYMSKKRRERRGVMQ